MIHQRPVTYAAARAQPGFLRNGDIALCRPASLEGRLIVRVTDAEYSHAAMIGFYN